jgi:hypothetical protein
MTSILLAILAFLEPQRSLPITVHLPTSEAIDVARQLARDLGYPLDRHPSLYFFDQLTGEGGKPSFAGYVSIGFYGGGHPISHFEINEATGQVVDSVTCKLFEFPGLRAFQQAQQKLSGSPPRTSKQLMDEIGCDKLIVVGKRVVPNAKPGPPGK